ncbi:hypothetical protein OBBRIDRAFT_857739, partial [Obba rivulosa]
SFDCDGWIHITLDDRCGTEARVKYTHREDHILYCCIDIPADMRERVLNGMDKTSTQLWNEILHDYPNPVFTRKAVYALWSRHHSQQYRLHEDELKSAQKFLEDAKRGYSVEPISLELPSGFDAIAFALPKILRRWSGRLREISLNSAWQTNGSRFELYAALTEAYRSGLPIGFLLIRSNDGEKHGKEKLISQFLQHIRTNWKISPKFTLSDKDYLEIHAMREQFPEAKHQLCYWHAARAVKTRLLVLRRAPAPYNVVQARKEFPDLDPNFVPVGQSIVLLVRFVCRLCSYRKQKMNLI